MQNTMRQFIRITPRQTPALARPFTTSRTLRIKEGAERSPEEVEEAKQESLRTQEWNKELASHGEESIKADREHVKDDDKHMEDLQKQTAQKSEEEHSHGKAKK